MSEKLVVEEKTVQKAVAKALKKLNTTKRYVNINVLKEPSNGLFGVFFVRNAKVEVERLYDPLEQAETFLRGFIEKMGIPIELKVERRSPNSKKPSVFHLFGEDVGQIIGKRGHTLEALQFITNLVANRTTRRDIRILIDVNDYREKREETLLQLAEKLKRQILINHETIVLDPMPANERKVIHQALESEPSIETKSEGEEPNRRVVITYVAAKPAQEEKLESLPPNER